MSVCLLAGALALSALPGADTVPGQSPGGLRGEVRQALTAGPVADAVVSVTSRSWTGRALTDAEGSYRVEAVPGGWAEITVRKQGYGTTRIRVRVPGGRTISVDFDLALQPVRMPDLRVAGLPASDSVSAGFPRGEEPGVERGNPGSPRMEALRSGPLGDGAMARAARRVARPDPADPSLLYLRGGLAPFKQVLLDGAPVHTPFHLGGLLSPYPPGLLGTSRLRSGGVPARFEGGLFYTLDLHSRPPGPEQGARTSGSVDRLGARATTRGRSGDLGYLVGGRALHPAPGEKRGSVTADRRYADLLGRLGWGGSGTPGATVTAFWNREAVPLAPGSSANSAADPNSEAAWGNAAVSVRAATGEGSRGWRFLAAAGSFRSQVPLAGEGVTEVDARVKEQRASVRRAGALTRVSWEAGASVRRRERVVELQRRRGPDSGVTVERLDRAGLRTGSFGEVAWQASDDVELRLGARADWFSPLDRVLLAPRASLTLHLEPETTLHLSGGRYRQLLALGPDTAFRHGEAGVGAGTAGPGEGGVGSATHTALRLEHRPDPDLRLGIEGHFKSLDGVDEPALSRTLHSSGLDVWLNWGSGRLAAWGTWSLAWLWSAEPGGEVSERFAARQVLTAGTEASLPGEVRASLSLSGSWGLPFTPLPAADAQQASAPTLGSGGSVDRSLSRARDAPYVRFDARVERSWRVRLLGADATLTPYAEVLNLLGRDDALFYRLPGPGAEMEPLDAVPLLPVVGVAWGR